MSSTTLYCQAISSLTGKQMEQLVLHKPVGWTANSTAWAAFAESYVSGYVEKTTIETQGALQPAQDIRWLYRL